jgi:hypothetical protein
LQELAGAVVVEVKIYDSLGRCTSITNADGTRVSLGDGVIEERSGGVFGASFVLDGTRSQDDGVIQMRRGGKDYFFHTDDQGNTLALTTTGGTGVERYDHDDYGAVTFLTGDGIPTGASASAVGNPYCWGGLRLDVETGLHNNDGGGYHEPQTGRAVRGKVKIVKDMGGSNFASNNPWTGGSSPSVAMKHYITIPHNLAAPGGLPWNGGPSVEMQKGTVKFFNDAKGFGFMAGGGGGGGGSLGRSKQSEAKSNTKAMFTAEKAWRIIRGGGGGSGSPISAGEPANSINDVNR